MPYRCKSVAVYGGVNVEIQLQSLRDVSVLVATPGRLIDLLSTNSIDLSAVDTLVLDEADKMLNLGFKDEMDEILTYLPEKTTKFTVFCHIKSTHRKCSFVAFEGSFGDSD